MRNVYPPTPLTQPQRRRRASPAISDGSHLQGNLCSCASQSQLLRFMEQGSYEF